MSGALDSALSVFFDFRGAQAASLYVSAASRNTLPSCSVIQRWTFRLRQGYGGQVSVSSLGARDAMPWHGKRS